MQRTPTCEKCQKNYELKDFRPVGPRIPLILPCGHTFCEGCLTKDSKLKPEINCFICEITIPLDPHGEKGVKNFVPNIYLLGLLMYNRRIALEGSDRIPGGPVSTFNGIGNILAQKKLPSDNQSLNSHESVDSLSEKNVKDRLLCDECSTKHATCQCKTCECRFCESCFLQVHKASKSLTKHVSLPLEYPSEEELSCPIHTGRTMEFFDNDLQEYVCALCIISERCKQHDIVPVSEMKDESNEELTDVVNKAKEVLKWYDYSNKILTDALPDEAREANQVFTNIHERFTTCHTLLLKRQMELMTEASEKIISNGSTNNLLQELAVKVRSLTTAIKDYEMVANDKRVMKIKATEFIQKFTELTEAPCIVQKSENSEDTNISFLISDSVVTDIEAYGKIKDRITNKFHFKSVEEIPEENQEKLLAQNENGSKIPSVIQINEILDENIPLEMKKPSRLSLMTGRYERVYVTHANDPTDFKIQRCADKDRLQVMMAALNKYCRHSNKAEDLVYKTEEGQLVCAQFLADNHWYRARVIKNGDPTRPGILPTWSNGLCVQVLYVDYGNSERLPLNRLRQIKMKFLVAPEMSVSCSLTDIVPPNKEVVWPERSIKAFNSLTGDRPLLMNIRKRINGKLYVDLRKPDDDDSLDDDRPISVRDAMVFLEVAVFFSPASHPNSDTHRSIRTYTEPDQLEKHTYIDVTVTHVVDPHTIFVQRLDSIILDEQKHLSQLYTSKNKRAWKIDWPYRNLVCAAKFSGDKTWYRAIVKHVHTDETVDVEYIDYGNSETLPFSHIKNIPIMYLQLQKQLHPDKWNPEETGKNGSSYRMFHFSEAGKGETRTKGLCWKVQLHHIDHVDGTTEWPDTCETELQDLLLNKNFVAAVKDFTIENVASVELFDTTTAEDININKLLVSIGLAKSTGPCSVPVNVPTASKDNQTKSKSDQNVITSNLLTNGSLPSYLPPVFPPGKQFIAAGVHVSENASIYLHIMQDDDHLQRIMCDLEMLSQTFKPPKTTENIYIGQPCVGQFDLDNLWYRVKVLEIISHNMVKVEFIDFGNTEEVPVNKIHLEAKHADIPAQCVAVELAGVKLKAGIDMKKYVEILSKMTLSEELKVESVSTCPDSNQPQVELWDNQNANIQHLLITQGLVEPIPIKEVETETVEEDPDSDAISITSDIIPAVIHQSNYLWYTKQRLPLVGTLFDVQVTQVNQPDLIFIQRNPADDDEKLLIDDTNDDTAQNAYEELIQLYQISDVINSTEYLTNESLDLETPIVGMTCVGKYSEDGLYYRAKIESIDEDKQTANVVFVDYGNAETLPINSLKTIWSDFVHLPMQSTQVKLAGVQPLTKDGISEWSLEERKQFFLMVANKRMIAQIIDDSDDVPLIHLYDRCLSEDSETGETVDVLIGTVLKDNSITDFILTDKQKKIALQ